MEPELKQWVELCLRSPSGDNCQPWLLKFVHQAFYITINEESADHFLDQNFAASWISIGTLCENLEQSAVGFGFSCEITIESEQCVKVLYQQIPKRENKSKSKAIENRITFRGKLNKANFDILKYNVRSEFADQNFTWNYKRELSLETISKWAELESILWLKTSLMKDFTKWVRVGVNRNLDGISVKNLMLNFFDSLSILIFKIFPAMINFVPFIIFNVKSLNRLKFLLNNSSGVIYLTGNFKTSKDYFLAGREIQSMWLYLTELGLKAQPLAIESLYFNYLDNQINRLCFSEKELKRLDLIKKYTFYDLDIKNDFIFMFRFGTSSEVIEFSPRKKLKL